MAKRLNTGIKDRKGVEVFTGDTVTMHYFGLGIGKLGGYYYYVLPELKIDNE